MSRAHFLFTVIIQPYFGNQLKEMKIKRTHEMAGIVRNEPKNASRNETEKLSSKPRETDSEIRNQGNYQERKNM